jgi:hypothetical protein
VRKRALLAAFVLLAGCGAFQDGDDEYQERLRAWQQSDHQLYRWTLVSSEPVFGPQTMTILVREGRPIRARSGNDKLEIEGVRVDSRPGTVDALIDWLIRYAPNAKSVNVEWASVGFSSKIELDHTDAIDDEVSFEVVEFVLLDAAP